MQQERWRGSLVVVGGFAHSEGKDYEARRVRRSRLVQQEGCDPGKSREKVSQRGPALRSWVGFDSECGGIHW